MARVGVTRIGVPGVLVLTGVGVTRIGVYPGIGMADASVRLFASVWLVESPIRLQDGPIWKEHIAVGNEDDVGIGRVVGSLRAVTRATREKADGNRSDPQLEQSAHGFTPRNAGDATLAPLPHG
jgi:hypothetical protein